MIIALIVVGAVAVAATWTLVVSGRVSIWPATGTVLGALGLAALATGRVELSPEVSLGTAIAGGLGAGIALWAATVAFVLVVRRWPVFDRHVSAIYDQRRGQPLWLALLLAAGVTAPGEELFWRGLAQGYLAGSLGWPGAAATVWAAYVAVNLSSRNLPIVAGALVAGAVWGALAVWTHGVIASLLCHVVWTALMLVAPPRSRGRNADRDRPVAGRGVA
jgi:membrane protease YdiL (CAAX protease family)